MNSDLLAAAKERIDDFRALQKAGLICMNDDFVPSVHYPPITMYRPITQEELFEGYELPADNKLDVYVHIPFCKQCCTFCHYPNMFGDNEKDKDTYLSALEKEMDIYMRILGIDMITPRSILIGGGTPTYMTPKQLERFLKYFCAKVDVPRCTQFNYDVDPSTLIGPEGKERLSLMKAHGVDRLTIGIQSLDNHVLQLMNRHHSAEEAVESVRACQEMGFQLNIEFIYGFPGQTMESWIGDIERATALGVEEIQIYRIKVQPYGDKNGVILTKSKNDNSDFLSIEEILAMKHAAITILGQHGYHENIRRVYTRERKHYSHYAHNQCCKLYDQLGFGLSAFSSLRDRFGLNTPFFKEYYGLIEQGRLPLNRGLVRSREEQQRWNIVLPLKNRSVHKKLFKERTGIELDNVFRDKIERLKRHGLLVENERKLELTPRGAFFADEVCHCFHSQAYVPFEKSLYTDGELNPYLP